MSRFHERLAAGEPAIGTFQLTNGVEWVDSVCHAGLDFVCSDFMVTAIDWAEAANTVRAAKQFNASPWIRLQGYPWGGTNQPENRTTADVLRAVSIGMEGITVSIDTPEQARAIVPLREELHRRPWMMENFPDPAFPDGDPASPEPIIFPLIESLEAADRIEEFFAIEGLATVMIGLGDLSRLLGAPSNHAPEMLKLVEKFARVAADAGKYLIVPTSAETSEEIRMFWDLGAKAIIVNPPPFVVQKMYRTALAGLESIRPRLTGVAATQRQGPPTHVARAAR